MTSITKKTVAQWQREGALLVEDGNHGENRPRKEEFSVQGMAFIRAADMADGMVLFEQAEKIDAVAQRRVRKGIGRPGDLIISHKGTIGRVARVPMDAPQFVCSPQTTFWRVIDEEKIDRDFLFALLRSPTFQGLFATRAGETDMAGYVSLTSQRELELSLPPIAIQREAGRTVCLLDDKIELNRKTAATLEEMARALYRSWFVDFDPVRARAEGRSPAHMDAATAALFPDSFGEDGLPEGWREGVVEELFTLQRGFDLPATARTEGAYPVMAAGGVHGTHSEFKVCGPGVTTGRSGVIGEVFLTQNNFWPLNTSLWVKKFKNGAVYFVYHFLRGLDLQGLNSGSAVPSLNRNNVHNLPAHIPPAILVEAFDRAVGASYKKISQLEAESRTLASIRDMLLPRLMSGELRVGAVRELVEEVA